MLILLSSTIASPFAKILRPLYTQNPSLSIVWKVGKNKKSKKWEYIIFIMAIFTLLLCNNTNKKGQKEQEKLLFLLKLYWLKIKGVI